MARLRPDPEEVGERGQAHPPQPPFQEPTGERGRAERRLGEAAPVQELQLPLEEALVKARVVRHEQVVACEGEKAAHDGGDRRRASELLLAQARQAGDRLGKRNPRIHE